jgi:hypothetical protein
MSAFRSKVPSATCVRICYGDLFVRHCLQTGRRVGWLDLTVRPIWKFLRAYVFRLGFLDGWPGYYIAWVGAFSTLTRYAKVLAAAQAKDPSSTEKH